jgi:hypothetical protein
MGHSYLGSLKLQSSPLAGKKSLMLIQLPWLNYFAYSPETRAFLQRTDRILPYNCAAERYHKADAHLLQQL